MAVVKKLAVLQSATSRAITIATRIAAANLAFTVANAAAFNYQALANAIAAEIGVPVIVFAVPTSALLTTWQLVGYEVPMPFNSGD